ncbi:hypothetical protein LCGC14_1203980 [marine sediment metagenome]|uniref:Uncharacterized protein n=1 Tax=marine sediment metagenome TaxID=412755 RepID=A0A0F9LG27_9ZZZZ
MTKLAEVKHVGTGWVIRLRPAEAKEIGSDWCPLPLTAEATLTMVEAHCRKIGYGGAKVSTFGGKV